jgi:hypothetical protein
MTKVFLASVGDKHWEIIADSEEEVVEILIGSVDLSSFPVSLNISEMVVGGHVD